MQRGGDVNLIGQFGVGFYSVYLVADYVEVISKHNDDKQHVWESSADGNFAVSEDKAGEPLGRGTLINIHLKVGRAAHADSCCTALAGGRAASHTGPGRPVHPDAPGAPHPGLFQVTPHACAPQEEAQDYLDEAKLKELVAKYSEFINFPIYLYASKEVDEPAEEEEEEPEAAAKGDEVEDEGAPPAARAAGVCVCRGRQ